MNARCQAPRVRLLFSGPHRVGRESFTVERWGAARERVYEATGLAGELHLLPDDADANGCGWPVTHDIAIGRDWRSGFYLVTLCADGAEAGRGVAHAGFVVRNGAESRSMVYVSPTNTWNAYNTWGGCSLYTGGTAVSFHRPLTDGGTHSNDSSERSFRIAGAQALHLAAEHGGTTLIEPVMSVEAGAPEDHLGAVIGAINARRTGEPAPPNSPAPTPHASTTRPARAGRWSLTAGAAKPR